MEDQPLVLSKAEARLVLEMVVQTQRRRATLAAVLGVYATIGALVLQLVDEPLTDVWGDLAPTVHDGLLLILLLMAAAEFAAALWCNWVADGQDRLLTRLNQEL